MELLLIIGAVIALAVLYFCFGIALKFLVAWWILLLGTPALIGIGLAYGWVGAVVAIVGFFFLVQANNSWSGSAAYLKIEKYVDKAFYLADT